VSAPRVPIVLLEAASRALDEAGDPTGCRDVLEAVPPPALAVRPARRKQRVTWAAGQLAHHAAAGDPARAYRALRELVTALHEPVLGAARPPAPAPEVALALAPAALLDAIAPPPRVLAAELARADLTARSRSSAFGGLDDPDPGRRVLAIRALRKPELARRADDLARVIASDPAGFASAEALAVATGASPPARAAIAAALAPWLEAAEAVTRTRVVDGLRQLGAVLDDARLAGLLAERDAGVRAAAARCVTGGRDVRSSEHAAALGAALRTCLSDPDRDVREAALGAVLRCTWLHGPELIDPLRAAALARDGDPRAAVYVLGALGAAAALADCVRHGRSDVAHVAELVLRQHGHEPPELGLDERVARATAELAADASTTLLAGAREARRLAGVTRAALVPSLRALVERSGGCSSADDELRLAVREALAAHGESADVPARVLEPWCGLVPVVRAIHGAYAIARAGSALGLWDHQTGRLVLAIDDALLLALVPGRAEVAVLCDGAPWRFERHAVPGRECLSSIAIPAALSHGRPDHLAVAGGLATVWCDAYRFHIKISPPGEVPPRARGDRVIDEVPHRR
jgi:hypothetical protein